MTKKDEFMALAEKYGYEHVSLANWASRNVKNEISLTKFVMNLNAHPDLRAAFREAVVEAKDVGEEDQAAAGLSKLFGGE